MKVMSKEESFALAEVMYENYVTTLSIEVDTMLDMVQTGFLPAFAKDLTSYKDSPDLAGDRNKLYSQVKEQAEKLRKLSDNKPHELKAEAAYICNTVKPQMETLRTCVDEAESIMERSLYPFPTYEHLLYGHHF